MLGGAAFALARMAPRRYERLADAGAATGVIDPLLVRAYLRVGHGAAGARAGRRHAAQRRRAAPVRDRRRAPRGEGRRREPVSVADARVPHRAGARSARRAARAGRSAGRAAARRQGRARAPRRRDRPERHTHEAMSAAMKLVVNSAYGYLAAGGGLTRFADVHAANEVTRRGRETARSDVPRARRARRDAARGRHRRRLLRGARRVDRGRRAPRRRRGRGAAAAARAARVRRPLRARCCRTSRRTTRCSAYDGTLVLRGVAFRSSRAEPFGEAFLRRAIALPARRRRRRRARRLPRHVRALRRRELPTLRRVVARAADQDAGASTARVRDSAAS